MLSALFLVRAAVSISPGSVALALAAIVFGSACAYGQTTPAISVEKMTLTPFEVPNRPEYLAKANRLVPQASEPKPGSSDEYKITFNRPGAIFLAAKPLGPAAQPNWREIMLRKVYTHQKMLPIGRCPWDDAALFFVLPVLDARVVTIKLPPGLKSLNFQGEELAAIEPVAVDNEIYADPKFSDTFGPVYQSGMNRVRAESLFRTKNWDELENFFAKLRKGGEWFGDGRSALDQAFNGTLTPADLSPEEYTARVKEYRTAKPKSAVVLLQQVATLATAWKSRGTGTADKVSPQAQDRLEKMATDSKGLLNDAKTAAPTDSLVEEYQLQTMAGGNAKPADFQRIALAGLKKDPWHYQLAASSSHYLAPRWFGDAKSASTLAKQLQKEIAGTSGPALYCIAALTTFRQEPDDWDSTRGFDYQQMLKGLEEFREKFPEERQWTALACQAAGHRGDLDTSRQLYDSLLGRMQFDDFGDDGVALEWYEFLHPPVESKVAWQASIIAKGANRLQFDPKGEKLYVVSPLCKVREFDAKTGKLLSSASVGFVPTFGVAANKKGETAVVSFLRTNYYKNGKGTKTVPYKPKLDLMTGDLSFDGRTAAGIMPERNGVIINAENGKQTVTDPLTASPVAIPSVKISADGNKIAFGMGQTSVAIYEAATGKLFKTLSFEDHLIDAFAFHTNGKRLVATGGQKFPRKSLVWEWDTETGQVLWSGPTPDTMRRLAVSEDGKYIAMGLDYTYDFLYDAKLWITPSQQETKENDFLVEQRQKIADLKWSPDAKQLAVVGDGGFVKVFRLDP